MKQIRPALIPRFSGKLFSKNDHKRNYFLHEDKNVFNKNVSRTFCSSQLRLRNKNEIYNTDLFVVPTLQPNRIRQKEKRGIPVVSPSQEFTKALSCSLEKVYADEVEHFCVYYPAGLKLDRYLKSRTLPLEGVKLRRKQAFIENTLREEFDDGQNVQDLPLMDVDQRLDNYDKRKRTLEKKLLDKWVPVEFDKTCGFSYLLARSSAEYAVLHTILQEIKYQEKDFRPKTFFDYGSGVGTGYWATKQIFGNFNEVFCVDASPEMNNIAKHFICKGEENVPLPLGVHFRVATPSTTTMKYDLVLSAYSMMEKSSGNARLETLNNLWSRVAENGCLVLVELGTNAGFQIISEARDYLLQIMEEDENIDIVAPCPHKKNCPRYYTDNIPCNFQVKYRMFDIEFFKKQNEHKESYSYVVLKKGKRSRAPLPRMVEEPKKLNKSYLCRLCTQRGTLQEVTCGKKIDSDLNMLCKRLHWGDEFPAHLDFPATAELEEAELEDEEQKESA